MQCAHQILCTFKRKKMKILYISGLSRSGTTYLSNLIVQEFKAVSLGEIIKNIEIYQNPKEKARYKNEDRKCTCGEYPENLRICR